MEDILSSRNFLIFVTLSTYIGTVFIMWVWNRRKYYSVSWKLPGPRSLPLIGSIVPTLRFLKYQMVALLEECQKYPGLFAAWLGPNFVVVVTEPEDLEVVYGKQVMEKPPKEYVAMKEFLGYGLFTMTGLEQEYKLHRKVVMPAFSSGKIRNYHKIMVKNRNILIESLNEVSNKGIFDIGTLLLRYTADVVAESFFGVTLNFKSGNLDEFLHITETCFKGAVEKIAKVWYWIRPVYRMTNLYKTQMDVNSKSIRLSNLILNERRKVYKDGDCENLADMLLTGLKNGDIQENEIIGETTNLWMASFDTSAITIQLVVTMLAIHKECQEKAYQEIKNFYDNREDIHITSEDLIHFPYTEMCMKETLRLFPPGPVTLRYSSHEVEFKSKDIVIPGGTTYIISSYVTHRNGKIWPNPTVFIPERFSKEECAKRHPLSFYPYSSGYRGCKGIVYSKHFIMTTLIYMLKNFELRSNQKIDDLKVSFDIDCRFDGGYNVEVIPRKEK